ncbi:hypothetical protein AYO45_04780 [Gammaproteobacteria bacterium SCGC AG-212-F23]|nr:hypothetical protein AYO45_04780 [Gammaproteobacteria bacterium SCGC AG-212-F23]
MMKINLLSWRHARRVSRRRWFYGVSCVIIAVSIISVVCVHGLILQTIQIQKAKNASLRDKIAMHQEKVKSAKILQNRFETLQIVEHLNQNNKKLFHCLDIAGENGVQLKIFNRHHNEVKLQGSVSEMDYLSEFLKKISVTTKIINVESDAATGDILFEVKIS